MTTGSRIDVNCFVSPSDSYFPTISILSSSSSTYLFPELISTYGAQINFSPLYLTHTVFFMFSGMVDVIFADVAQPDQARIVALNAHYFLKNGGHFVISIKASCIDSTAAPEAVFAREVKKLQGTFTCCCVTHLCKYVLLDLTCTHILSNVLWNLMEISIYVFISG